MSKVMIVEDDESLREIYSIRLTAEGYTVISAHDGEEALAVAVKERPDLIVSDVMMPKITGFDMLDILRSTPETQNIKVIMMTALSSDDQRVRGENLGADRYLVKSQVGIEDVVNVVHDVLGDRNTGGTMVAAPAIAQPPVVTPESLQAMTTPVSAQPMMPPVLQPAVATPQVAPAPQSIPTMPPQVATPATSPIAQPAPVAGQPTAPTVNQPVNPPVVPSADQPIASAPNPPSQPVL